MFPPLLSTVGENFPRAKLDAAQGFLFVSQGENIYLENMGENFQSCERSSHMEWTDLEYFPSGIWKLSAVRGGKKGTAEIPKES